MRPAAAVLRRRAVRRVLAAFFLLLLAACGENDSIVVRPPESTKRSTSSAPTTSPSIATVPTATPSAPQITVTPSAGLVSGQTVRVTGSGFTAHEGLIATQCADKGSDTSQGDCNLAGLVSTTSDANGNVDLELTVVGGPFGANQIVCGPRQGCLVSVSQASPSPSEQADAPIAFG